MFTDLVQEPQIGDVEHVERMEIGRREQCADIVESEHRIEFVQLQSRRMRKRQRSMQRKAPTVATSRRLQNWRSSSRQQRMKNKRLAAKAQQMDKAKELDVLPDAVCVESEAADLDELQTLVDLSNKYFPESMHNATLREKLDAERKKKQAAKPVQAKISNMSRRLEKKRKAKRALDQSGGEN